MHVQKYTQSVLFPYWLLKWMHVLSHKNMHVHMDTSLCVQANVWIDLEDSSWSGAHILFVVSSSGKIAAKLIFNVELILGT